MKIYSLCLITDSQSKYTNVETITYAIKGGIKWIQLRDKLADTFAFFQQAKIIRKITRKHKVIFLVNDRIEIAKAVDADGVHLGKNDLPVKVARKLLGKNKIIGLTCKSIEEISKAKKEGADYISIGPIFQSITKPNAGKILGVEFIKEAKKYTFLPIVAIGGINQNNMIDCFKAGVDAVAISAAIVRQKNLSKATSDLLIQIKRMVICRSF